MYSQLSDRSLYSLYTNLLGVGLRVSAGTCLNVDDCQLTTTHDDAASMSRDHTYQPYQ